MRTVCLGVAGSSRAPGGAGATAAGGTPSASTGLVRLRPLRRLTDGIDPASAGSRRDEGRVYQDTRQRDAERILIPDVKSCSRIAPQGCGHPRSPPDASPPSARVKSRKRSPSTLQCTSRPARMRPRRRLRGPNSLRRALSRRRPGARRPPACPSTGIPAPPGRASPSGLHQRPPVVARTATTPAPFPPDSSCGHQPVAVASATTQAPRTSASGPAYVSGPRAPAPRPRR